MLLLKECDWDVQKSFDFLPPHCRLKLFLITDNIQNFGQFRFFRNCDVWICAWFDNCGTNHAASNNFQGEEKCVKEIFGWRNISGWHSATFLWLNLWIYVRGWVRECEWRKQKVKFRADRQTHKMATGVCIHWQSHGEKIAFVLVILFVFVGYCYL